MKNFLTSLKALGRTQQIALGVAGAALLGALAYFSFYAGAGASALLYGELDLTEAAEMADDLAKAHISFTTSQDGTRIFVAKDKVASARLLLAKDGLPSGGAVGYELFDKSGTLTSTQFEQSINETRAMEGELERSIRLLHGVRNVRVHLVLPHRDLFSTETNPSQASVVLDIGRAGRMAPDGIQASRTLLPLPCRACARRIFPSWIRAVMCWSNRVTRTAWPGRKRRWKKSVMRKSSALLRRWRTCWCLHWVQAMCAPVPP